MFQRRVLPAEEELWDAVLPAAFAVVWYSSLIRALTNGTTNMSNAAILMIGGVLPLYIAFIKGRTALSCRKKRREAVSVGRCCRGVVRRIETEKVPVRGRHGRIHYQKRYYLTIEKIEDGFDFGTEIKTGAYRVPVHLYLKSTEVKLYADASGWNWYVEGLQCGRFRQRPMLIGADCSDGEYYVEDVVFRIVFLAIVLFIFLQGIW